MPEKTLESPLDCREIQPVHPKGDQSWIFIARTEAEAEAPIILPPDAKSWLVGKDPDAGKDWRRAEKGTTEDEMVRWHHWLNGHESEQALGDGGGQGSLACCSLWVHKESAAEKTTANKKFSPDLNSIGASPHVENLKANSQKASGAESGLKPRSVWFYSPDCPLRRYLSSSRLLSCRDGGGANMWCSRETWTLGGGLPCLPCITWPAWSLMYPLLSLRMLPLMVLSHKKEGIWDSSDDTDEPWVYCTKSKREKQISYIKAYIRKLERRHWWAYLQGSNGDADTEKTRGDTVGKGELGRTGRHMEARTLTYMKQTAGGICSLAEGAQLGVLCPPRCVGGGREAREGGDMCMPLADSCWYMEGANTIL